VGTKVGAAVGETRGYRVGDCVGAFDLLASDNTKKHRNKNNTVLRANIARKIRRTFILFYFRRSGEDLENSDSGPREPSISVRNNKVGNCCAWESFCRPETQHFAPRNLTTTIFFVTTQLIYL
jgi:hypothetical protein